MFELEDKIHYRYIIYRLGIYIYILPIIYYMFNVGTYYINTNL